MSSRAMSRERSTIDHNLHIGRAGQLATGRLAAHNEQAVANQSACCATAAAATVATAAAASVVVVAASRWLLAAGLLEASERAELK